MYLLCYQAEAAAAHIPVFLASIFRLIITETRPGPRGPGGLSQSARPLMPIWGPEEAFLVPLSELKMTAFLTAGWLQKGVGVKHIHSWGLHSLHSLTGQS